MRKLYIIKLGETFTSIAGELGDFEHWIQQGLKRDTAVVDPRRGDALPAPEHVAGVVLTGSHAMVTDTEHWSERTAQWLVEVVEQKVPLLGICYGHQLLAQAHGGEVDYHPGGMEIGTVGIQLTEAAAEDPLFHGLPAEFPAQVTHSQSVRRLPPSAVRLAGNAFEPVQAYRLGACAWGVQFHPEFSACSTRAYIRQLATSLREKQLNPRQLERNVRETPDAALLLERFAQLVAELQGDEG